MKILKPSKDRLWCVVLPSIMFGLATAIGRTMDKYNSFYGIKTSPVKYTALFVGSGLIFFTLAYLLFGYIENAKPAEKSENKLFAFLFDRKPFFIPFCAFIVAWLPYIVSFRGRPGWDFCSQVEMFFGNIPFTNHHPVFSTVCYGLVMKICCDLGFDRAGIPLFALFQTLSMAAMLSLILVSLKRIPHIARFVILAVFAFSPGIALFSVCVCKDLAYALFFALFTLSVYFIIRDKTLSPKKLAFFVIVSVMCVLLRNNGFHVLAPSVILLFFVKGISKKQTAAVLGAVCLTYIAMHNIIQPALGIPESSIRAAIVKTAQRKTTPKESTREILSMPFQQTARYIIAHGEEITPEEKNTIDKVLVYDKIAERYNPIVSDPVKNLYLQRNPSKEDLLNYSRLWFTHMRKHPMTYAAAAINNTYGYFYPAKPGKIGARLYPVTEQRLRKLYYCEETVKWLGLPDNAYTRKLAKLRNVCLRTPILKFFTDIPFFTWLMIIACFYMIKREKYVYLPAVIPCLLTLLVCLVSPVNGELRYALPYMFCAPFFIGLCFLLNEENHENK